MTARPAQELTATPALFTDLGQMPDIVGDGREVSGCVRLQEANAGEPAVAEVMRAVAEARAAGIAVVAVVGGKSGAFDGAGLTARDLLGDRRVGAGAHRHHWARGHRD